MPQQINLYFIAPYFINDHDIKGAIGHRIYEVSKLIRQSKDINMIWYSYSDNCLKTTVNEFRLSHFKLIRSLLKDKLKKQKVFVWFCYPYTDSLMFLLFIPIFIFLKIRVFTDYVDLPLIKNRAQLDRKNFYYYLLYDLLNRHYNFSIFSSYCIYIHYLEHYHFQRKKCLYLPLTTSSFHKKYVTSHYPKLTLGYIGSNTEIESLIEFVDVINVSYKKNIPLRLIIIGNIKCQKYFKNFGWIDFFQQTNYFNLYKIFNEVDIGIVPYPKRWDKILPHKFICYISHSIPVLSTNNKEIATFISNYNCGIIYKNNHELIKAISDIIDHKYDLQSLSNNSDQCANFFFNSIKYQDKLHGFIKI